MRHALTGVERIAIERKRQVEVEEYDASHDAAHDGGELAIAAACYAASAAHERIYVRQDYAAQVRFVDPWPWEDRFDKRPHDGNVLKDPDDGQTLRLLEKAGAMIAAEIDRRLRASSPRRTLRTSSGSEELILCVGCDHWKVLNTECPYCTVEK